MIVDLMVCRGNERAALRFVRAKGSRTTSFESSSGDEPLVQDIESDQGTHIRIIESDVGVERLRQDFDRRDGWSAEVQIVEGTFSPYWSISRIARYCFILYAFIVVFYAICDSPKNPSD
jgi:hypothetical protein